MQASEIMQSAYSEAQQGITFLKSSIYKVLSQYPEGLKNVEIGRLLGIYQGHIRHEGHIPRTLLEIMKEEGILRQDEESKKWFLVTPE